MLPAVAFLALVQTPEQIPLWKDGAPGFERLRDVPEVVNGGSVRNVNNPSITVFRPPAGTANGTAVVVVPAVGTVRLASAAREWSLRSI